MENLEVLIFSSLFMENIQFIIFSMPVTKVSKTEIAEFTLKEFLSQGIQAITLKQLATETAVSTKTLYKLFTDKSGLLRNCLELHYSRFFHELQILGSQGENEVETFVIILDRVVSVEFQVNPKFYAELNKYYPGLQTEVGTKYNNLHGIFGKIIKQGKSNGLFLQTIDGEVSLITLQRLYHGITRELVYKDSGLSGPELVKNTVFLYLRGMCTPLGIQKLEEALKKSQILESVTQKNTIKNEKNA